VPADAELREDGRSADPTRPLVMLGVMIATLTNSLDATIANVALPHMQGSLSSSPSQITWVVTSYIVAMAVATPVAGWLGGRFGIKRVLLVAIAGFTLSSMLCGIAGSVSQMVLFRLLQGLTGAAIMPLSQATVLHINPPERHQRALATWTLGNMLGPALGPVIGGYLTDQFSWRWCFFINAPLGLASVLLLWLFMRSNPPAQRRPFDVMGFAALTVAVAAFQLLLDRGPTNDWFESVETWTEALLAAGGLWVFIAHSGTALRPMFDPGLIRDRNLVVGTLVGTLIMMLMYSSLTIIPIMMQTVLGYPALTAGWVGMPRGLAVLTSIVVVGRLSRADPRALMFFGLSLQGFAFWQVTQFDLSMDMRPVLVTGVLQGLGQGMVMVPLNLMAFSTIRAELRADAASVFNLLRNVGGSIGVASMQGLVDRNRQAAHAALADHVIMSDPVVRAALPPAFSPETVNGALALNDEINRQVALIAYMDDFVVMVVVIGLVLPLILLLRPPRRARPALAEAAPGGAAAEPPRRLIGGRAA